MNKVLPARDSIIYWWTQWVLMMPALYFSACQ